jgi:hypothetical protein
MKVVLEFNRQFKYQKLYGKISAYTTSFNAETMCYPYKECIESMLGFADEVVVVDHSTDNTYQELLLLQKEYGEDKLKLFQNEWDANEPGMDGIAKAFARALCTHEFLWQQDLDEVVHEDDYEKIRVITKKFPQNCDLLHLPVVELWGDANHFTYRRHSWKWRMSRNKPEITHAINKHARLTHPETGRIYAKEGMSDGCEYVNCMNYDYIPHMGFYNEKVEQARLQEPIKYGQIMNEVYNHLPSVFHYSWASLPNKIQQFRKNWDKQWGVLYQKQNDERFPGIETTEQIRELSKELYQLGGEQSDSIKGKIKLQRTNPTIMQDWIRKNCRL